MSYKHSHLEIKAALLIVKSSQLHLLLEKLDSTLQPCHAIDEFLMLLFFPVTFIPLRTHDSTAVLWNIFINMGKLC